MVFYKQYAFVATLKIVMSFRPKRSEAEKSHPLIFQLVETSPLRSR